MSSSRISQAVRSPISLHVYRWQSYIHTMEQSFSLRTDVSLDDLQAIIDLHGSIYAAEQGWNVSFKVYVAGPLIDAARGLSPRSRIWIAEHGGKLVGCIGMIEASKEAAQLRWLLVDPKARNQGLGKRLLTEALTFAREQGFDSVFLWTESSLTVAARLYAAAGFRKTEERAGWKWGAGVVEERYELSMAVPE